MLAIIVIIWEYHKKSTFFIDENTNFSRGDIKIPHNRITKSCWETLVTYLFWGVEVADVVRALALVVWVAAAWVRTL